MYLLAVGSVTNAMRGRDALNKYSIKSNIERSKSDKRVGCGYSIAVKDDAQMCKNILDSAGIKVLDVRKK